MSDSVYGLGSIPWGVGLFAATPILELDTKQWQNGVRGCLWSYRGATDKWRLTLGARL